MTYGLVDNPRNCEIRGVTACNPKHEMFVPFSLPLPDATGLKDGADIRERFDEGVDDEIQLGQD